jgi:hypothetical protein
MSYAMSGFNPMAASSLPQLLGVAQSIVPGMFSGPAGGYGMMPSGYGSGYGSMQGAYGMPAPYGAGYAVPVGTYTVTQTAYQQAYYGMSPGASYATGCPSGMCGTMVMPAQAGWGGGYYPGYY